jgi:hypothetical protein
MAWSLMIEMRVKRLLLAPRCALAMLCLAGAGSIAAAADFSVGLLSLASDARYTPQTLEKAYPDAPAGRSLEAVKMALEDASFALQGAGFAQGRVIAAEALDVAGLPAALAGL